MARNPSLEATIVRVERAAEPTQDDREEQEQGLSTKGNTRTSSEVEGGMSGTPVLFSQLTVQGGGAVDTGAYRVGASA